MDYLRDVLGEQILVFLGEASYVIDDVTSIVLDLELGSLELACFLIMRILRLFEINLMEFTEQIFIISSNGSFFINEAEE